ncbi:hypothetical protein K2V56_02310 [Staphylococcus chromogenes]|uniref:hypothetical protein n=2 Tax=Staphylococcus chromogenes TaxID=46126 RepID=UPI001E35715F|nr:hypothetical protein [Staphylococcus chromogenes]MCD8904297.1 hypothetical protein [Staphylococcus chromogenes]
MKLIMSQPRCTKKCLEILNFVNNPYIHIGLPMIKGGNPMTVELRVKSRKFEKSLSHPEGRPSVFCPNCGEEVLITLDSNPNKCPGCRSKISLKIKRKFNPFLLRRHKTVHL